MLFPRNIIGGGVHQQQTWEVKDWFPNFVMTVRRQGGNKAQTWHQAPRRIKRRYVRRLDPCRLVIQAKNNLLGITGMKRERRETKKDFFLIKRKKVTHIFIKPIETWWWIPTTKQSCSAYNDVNSYWHPLL